MAFLLIPLVAGSALDGLNFCSATLCARTTCTILDVSLSFVRFHRRVTHSFLDVGNCNAPLVLFSQGSIHHLYPYHTKSRTVKCTAGNLVGIRSTCVPPFVSPHTQIDERSARCAQQK